MLIPQYKYTQKWNWVHQILHGFGCFHIEFPSHLYFQFLFSLHLTEWTVNKISVGISALISFLGRYFYMSTSSICLLSNSLLGLEHRCYCKSICWIFDRVCLMFTSNERSAPLFIGISPILCWLCGAINIKDTKQTSEHNL